MVNEDPLQQVSKLKTTSGTEQVGLKKYEHKSFHICNPVPVLSTLFSSTSHFATSYFFPKQYGY